MKHSKPIKLFIFTCISIALLQASSVAQSESSTRKTGKLEGVVLDINEARIMNASIKIEGRHVKRELVSDEEGRFQAGLPVGTYQMTVYSPGFGRSQRKGLKVQANFTTKLNIPLQVAAIGPCPNAKSKGKGIVICE